MALTTEEVDICNQSLGRIGAKTFAFGDVTSNQSKQSLLHFDQARDALLRSFEWPFAKTRLRLVSAWETLAVYTTDQYVWQASLLYKCAVAHTAGTFADDLTSVYWTLVSTVSAWVTATGYVVGGFVVNNAIYYKCITAHTSGDTDDEPGVGATTATYWQVYNTKPVDDFGYSYDLPASSLRLVEFNDDTDIDWPYHYHPHYHRWHLETNTILTDLTEVDIVYIDQIDTTTEWDSLFMEMFIAQLALNLLNPLTGAGSTALNLRQLLLKELKSLRKQTRTIGRQEGNNSGRPDWNTARYVRTFYNGWR